MLPLVYSPAYNITALGLERLHPFDSVKYRRIQRWLVGAGVRRPAEFVVPTPLTAQQLLRVHSAGYLASLAQREVLFSVLEVPVVRRLPAWVTRWRVLRPMLLASAGTVLAARLALQHGLAINLGGGYHHAAPQRGSGFCVYADIPLALQVLHDEGLIRTALVIDVDAHQGDGVAIAVRDWSWAHVLDVFEAGLFPFPKEQEEAAVPLPPGMRWPEYHAVLQRHLPAALDRIRPDLVICNAGSDVLASDPITNFLLTPGEMVLRDQYIADEVRRRGIALAMTLSGGYGPDSWEAHARSIAALVERFEVAPTFSRGL